MDFTPLENTVISWLLAGDDPVLEKLRSQFAFAHVQEREYTGVGVFVTLSIPASAPKVDPPRLTIGDIALEVEGVQNGAGVVLFVNDGLLDLVEIYTYNDRWPEDAKLKSISYLTNGDSTSSARRTSPKRDIEALKRSWQP
jgi:hypothetical protein